MPDSNWQELPPDDAATRNIENSRDANGDMPGATRSKSRTDWANQPNGMQERTVTDTYHILEYEGNGGSGIVHKCIRCGGRHEHYLHDGAILRPDIVYAPLCVLEAQWGQGPGWLFGSVKVTGTEYRRIQTYRRRGPGARETVMVSWDERSIDHEEQRDFVELEAFTTIVDCASGAALQYGLRDEGWAGDILVAAIDRTSGIGADAELQLPDNVIAAVGRALAGRERPRAYTEMRDGRLTIAIVDRTDVAAVRIGRVGLDVSPLSGRVSVGKFVAES